MQVALFGGSFNPPHVAHVLAVAYVLSTEWVDKVLVTPVFAHPFDKALVPFEHRVAMSEKAVGWIPGVEVSTIESELEPPNLTLRTVEVLRERHPTWRLRLMVGADVLHDAPKWHAFDEVVRRAPLLLGRAGHPPQGGARKPAGAPHADVPPPVLPDISSTQIREWLFRRAREPEVFEELRRWVPRRVLDYIEEHDLYR
jgi:nicotinate-nucleotide adenylyltransferase